MVHHGGRLLELVSNRVSHLKSGVKLTSLTVDTSDVQLVNNVQTLRPLRLAAISDLLLLAPVPLFTLLPPLTSPALLRLCTRRAIATLPLTLPVSAVLTVLIHD